MSTLISNLNYIESCKLDIKSAIEAKGVDMTGVSFPDYATAIENIPAGGGYTEKEITEGVQIVNLSNSASLVRPHVFQNNTYLQTVNLPNCTEVGSEAFRECRNLTTVNIPVCTSIGSSAFMVCSSLTSINMPLITYMGNNAFYSCSSLTNIDIPVCTNIGQSAFANCSSLTSIDLPVCEVIGPSVFVNCTSLISISLPVCTNIEYGAFSGCTSLTSINLPVCEVIGNSAFRGCRSLNSLTLCTDVYWTIPYQSRMLSDTPIMSGTGSIYVREDTYSIWITSKGWSSLIDRFVSVETSGYALSFSEGIVYGTTKVLKSDFTNYLGISKNDILSIDLPMCKSISIDALRNCTSLSQVNLPVYEYIDNWFVSGCTSLSQIELPVCSYIGYHAFDGCSSLTSIVLPSCEYLEIEAFSNCTSLSQIELPVCSYIGNLALFDWSASSRTIILKYDGVVTAGGGQPIAYNSVTKVYVPASLVDAYKSAQYWSTYSSQIFPMVGSQLSFSDGLLYGTLSEIYPDYINTYNLGIVSDDVVSVSLPDCTYVGNTTFQSHYNLASVYMPSLTYVGVSGFRHCSALQSIDLPVCTEIGTSAFIGCDLRSISAPNLVTAGSWAFGNNYNLSYVDLPAFEGTSVSGTFNGCSSLSAVSLPALKDVGMRMFDSCNLYSITLPAASQIRISAFNNNSNLSEIYLPGSYVCGLGNINALNGTPIASGTGSIYVPWSLLDTYKARPNWSVFASQIYPIGGYPELSFSDGLLYGSASTITKSSWTALGISSADIVSINLNQLEYPDEMFDLFSGCTNLTTVSLPVCTTIRTEMFRDCVALSNVYIPACITIEAEAFWNCTSLSQLTLSACEEIRNQAFSSAGLASLTIYTESVCNQVALAFGGTPIASGTGLIYVPYSLLEDYKVASHWSYYSSQIFAYDPPVEDLFFDGETGLVYGTASFIDSTYLDVLGITAEQVSAVSLPDCTYVGSSTFKAHPNLVSVSLPACTEVFTQGFSGCSQLQEAYLPNCVTLGAQAFFSCNALNSINLDNCEVVSTGALRYCYNLSTLSLPKATNMYINCFANCSNMNQLYLLGSSIVTLSAATVFTSCPTAVIVPESLYQDYLAANIWSTISSRLYPNYE